MRVRRSAPLSLFLLTLTACPSYGPPSGVECSSYDDIACPAGEVCLDFHCYQACQTHSGCAPAEACITGGCQTYTANCDTVTGAGCIEGFYCSSTGACEKQLDIGADCNVDTDCASGHCVDSVCCLTVCDSCEACSTAITGEPSGACHSVPTGEDPNDNCAGPLACNGAGACFGSTLGDACAADYECASGHCTDGVCCDSACDGGCEACVASITGGSDGTCAAVPIGEDPKSTCTNGYGCNGAGACLAGFADGTPCGAPEQCASGYCVDNVCCGSACDALCANGCGTDGVCVVRPSTYTCRAAAGTCDIAERCTGDSEECPPDVIKDASTICRAATGSCDLPEYCTGAAIDCPTNAGDATMCDICSRCSATFNCEFDGTLNDCGVGLACYGPGQCTVSPGTPCVVDANCGFGVCRQFSDVKACVYAGVTTSSSCAWNVDAWRSEHGDATATFDGSTFSLRLFAWEDDAGAITNWCSQSSPGGSVTCANSYGSVTASMSSTGITLSGSCSAAPTGWH